MNSIDGSLFYIQMEGRDWVEFCKKKDQGSCPSITDQIVTTYIEWRMDFRKLTPSLQIL